MFFLNCRYNWLLKSVVCFYNDSRWSKVNMNKKPSCMVLCAPGAALPALGMNFNALKRSFCFGLLASVHVRDHVRAVVREKLQRSTTANSIVPCSTFFAAHHRVSKKEFHEWLRQEQFTTFQDITKIDFLCTVVKITKWFFFFVTSEELFHVCFDTFGVINYLIWDLI